MRTGKDFTVGVAKRRLQSQGPPGLRSSRWRNAFLQSQGGAAKAARFLVNHLVSVECPWLWIKFSAMAATCSFFFIPSFLSIWQPSICCELQNAAAPLGPLRCQASTEIYAGTESATPATNRAWATESVTPAMQSAAAPLGPTSLPSFCGHLCRYWKCDACHTNQAWAAESATPVTQTEP